LNKKFRREGISVTVWNIKRKATRWQGGGGTAELPPPTSYPTSRTSEKPKKWFYPLWAQSDLALSIVNLYTWENGPSMIQHSKIS